MYLKKVTCPFFVKIDFLIGYDKLGYGEQNLPGWQFFKCPEVRFSGHLSDVINDVIIRHPEKKSKIFFFQIYMYHIPLERKFSGDQKSLWGRSPEMKWKKVISPRRHRNE